MNHNGSRLGGEGGSQSNNVTEVEVSGPSDAINMCRERKCAVKNDIRLFIGGEGEMGEPPTCADKLGAFVKVH